MRNLSVQAQGTVKSNKFFPVFLENEKEIIFKPLSKTKPLSTPYFAYSEVFWSTIINRYFDSKTPIYKLAICKNIDKEFESKYSYGTVVSSIEKSTYDLVNLYEIFRDFSDPSVDIKDYINYCEKFYDYRCIFESNFMKERVDIAQDFAMQVLISILKIDQNYHYENPLFYSKNGEICAVAPMIDHEFSTMFLYLDDPQLNKKRFYRGVDSLRMAKNSSTDIFAALMYESFPSLSKNLDTIILNYPEIVNLFLEKLKDFIHDFEADKLILEDNNYLFSFNSSDFMIGHARYKAHNEEQAKKLEVELTKYNPDIDDISNIIYNEVLQSSQILEQELEKRLVKCS